MVGRFEWVTQGLANGPDTVCDVDLSRSQSFALVPSLGSIVEGWLLAIPRRKLLSLRELKAPERMDLVTFSVEAVARLRSISSQFVMFEHGPVEQQSKVGCGVDQAHLHVVSTKLDLLSDVLSDDSVEWMEADINDPWSSLPKQREYYLIFNSSKAYVGFPRAPISQFFRRRLAALSQAHEKWNYRQWPQYENARRTIDAFACSAERKAA